MITFPPGAAGAQGPAGATTAVRVLDGDYNAVSGNIIIAMAIAADVNIFLPSSPSEGDAIIVFLYAVQNARVMIDAETELISGGASSYFTFFCRYNGGAWHAGQV